MSMMVSFVLSFFPRDVLDEILNLIESVSEDFPSYFCLIQFKLKYFNTNHQTGKGMLLLLSMTKIVGIFQRFSINLVFF